MDGVGMLPIINFQELMLAHEQHVAAQKLLHPSDQDHDRMFAFDLKLGYLDVYWGGYEYSFELKRLDSPAKALSFIHHITSKSWEHSTADRVSLLIAALNNHFKWNMYGNAE